MAQPRPGVLGIHIPPSALVALLSSTLLSISFLVAINSFSPFVLSTLLGVPSKHTGSYTSRLLLADELTALAVYLPVGAASDRGGVKAVAVAGYVVVAAGLMCYVHAPTFAWLVAARVFFAVGAGTLVTTMSAMLSTVTASASPTRTPELPSSSRCPYRPQAGPVNEETPLLGEAAVPDEAAKKHPAAGRLAGLMGFSSGMGALLAVFGFLRLPAFLSHFLSSRGPSDLPPEEGTVDSRALVLTFYFIAAIAIAESVLLAVLLPSHKPRRPDNDGLGAVQESKARRAGRAVAGLFEGFRLAGQSGEVALGYLSSFASRAQAVIVTAYIPLLVNRYLFSHKLCDPTTLSSPSSAAATSCHRAYILSSILTGSIQLIFLLLCPIIGYLSTCPLSSFRRRSAPPSSPSSVSVASNTPSSSSSLTLTLSFLLGSLSFLGFSLLPHDGDPRSPISWLYVIGMGIAQAAGVVLSLALVTTGRASLAQRQGGEEGEKREIAGALSGSYALSGGLGILIVGGSAGWAFDRWWPGAPFLLMAVVDGLVALASAVLWLRS